MSVESAMLFCNDIDYIYLICCKPCSLKISDECKVCIYCKDKPKYGGKNTLKQKCIERICIKKRKKNMVPPSTSTPPSPKRIRHML